MFWLKVLTIFLGLKIKELSCLFWKANIRFFSLIKHPLDDEECIPLFMFAWWMIIAPIFAVLLFNCATEKSIPVLICSILFGAFAGILASMFFTLVVGMFGLGFLLIIEEAFPFIKSNWQEAIKIAKGNK